MQILSFSVDQTRQAGSNLAKSSHAGDTFALIGELG
jgi:tRNA A37 threonylcarbamoyladenosine biosynthesis protein TsaE